MSHWIGMKKVALNINLYGQQRRAQVVQPSTNTVGNKGGRKTVQNNQPTQSSPHHCCCCCCCCCFCEFSIAANRAASLSITIVQFVHSRLAERQILQNHFHRFRQRSATILIADRFLQLASERGNVAVVFSDCQRIAKKIKVVGKYLEHVQDEYQRTAL